MGYIDFILNLAALLLWFSWRAARLPPGSSSPNTLLGVLKRPASKAVPAWWPAAILLGLLFIRSFLYWNLGSALEWTPHLNLVVFAVPFRSEFWGRMLLFSGLSFALVLLEFYCGLLLLTLVNPHALETGPLQKLTRQQLGPVANWPAGVLWLLPALISGLLWFAVGPLFTKTGLVPPVKSLAHLSQQAMLLGLAAYLAWQWPVILVLLLHLLNSHIYLGAHPFWDLVTATARNLLHPLRRAPLMLGRLDLSPVLGMALVWGLGHFISLWLPEFFKRLPL